MAERIPGIAAVKQSFTTGPERAGERLDTALAAVCGLSRSRAARLIAENRVLVSGSAARAALRLREGDLIEVDIPDPAPARAVPEDIPLDIVYEDAHLIVINKQRGLVVHPSAGHAGGTLVNALLFHCADLSGVGGALRPGIVHRIDKDTTGLIVAAKNDAAHQALAAQIKEKTAGRTYLALVEGRVGPDSGRVDAPIGRSSADRKRMAVVEGGRSAVSDYEVLERFIGETLLQVSLSTGRTHQIRVHMAHIGHPVVGDPVYGSRRRRGELPGQLLHAAKLEFVHPATGEPMTFTAPLPDDFAGHLSRLRSAP